MPFSLAVCIGSLLNLLLAPSDSLISLSYSMAAFSANSFGLFYVPSHNLIWKIGLILFWRWRLSKFADWGLKAKSAEVISDVMGMAHFIPPWKHEYDFFPRFCIVRFDRLEKGQVPCWLRLVFISIKLLLLGFKNASKCMYNLQFSTYHISEIFVLKTKTQGFT